MPKRQAETCRRPSRLFVSASTRPRQAAGPANAFSRRIQLPKEKFTILEVKPGKTVQSVAVTRPVLQGPHGALATYTDEIIVSNVPKQFSWKKVPGAHQKLFEDRHVYVLKLKIENDFEKVLKQLQDAGCEAEPNYIVFTHRPKTTPQLADPLLHYQWAMTRIKATDAWADFGSGSSDVTIAIVDEGVDTSHPDLADSIVFPYDATDDDTYQEPKRYDAHGTACAGLAAAIHNAEGIRGVSGGSKIMPIRIAFSHPWQDGWFSRNSFVVRGIAWAVDHGARVISNSWGGGPHSKLVAAEMRRGVDNGCVVIAAAGNDSLPVGFPATIPQVIAVSATNENDEFKREYDSSLDYSWGSNYGPEVDIAAPGVLMATTDIVGSGGYAGYRSWLGPDYAGGFNGTSSSTPLVAGCVALMLSVNSSLSPQAVRRMLHQSADKIGGNVDPYDENGRNDYMGYGRLNVYKAVQLALQEVPSGENLGSEPNRTANTMKGTLRRQGPAFFLDTTGRSLRLYSVGRRDTVSPEKSQALDLALFNSLVGTNVVCFYMSEHGGELHGCQAFPSTAEDVVKSKAGHSSLILSYGSTRIVRVHESDPLCIKQYSQEFDLPDEQALVPSDISLRKDMSPVRDQGGAGTCSSFGVMALLEFKHGRQDLSEAHLTHHAEKTYGDCNGGLALIHGMQAARTVGAVLEKHWTYDDSQIFWSNPPDVSEQSKYKFSGLSTLFSTPRASLVQNMTSPLVSSAAPAQKVNRIKAILAQKRVPVAVSVPVWFSSSGRLDAGWDYGPTIYMPTEQNLSTWLNVHAATPGNIDGWHVIAICGFSNRTGRFLFKNSWGSWWGDAGYATIPFDYIARYADIAMYGW